MHMNNQIEKYRQEIAKKIRQLRQERQWTQKELAKLLGLSQNRLSEIEGGQGSFTAEQLLLLSKNFNVPVSDFVSIKGKADQKIQNALARLGATHLLENQASLPSEKLDQAVNLVYETLIAANSSRQIAALGPVIVNYATPPTLNKLRIRFNEAGLINRFGWLLDNVRYAINEELGERLPADWHKKYAKADLVLKNLLDFPWFKLDSKDKNITDILDDTIAHPKDLKEVRSSSSNISKKWGVVSLIKPDDFVNALKEARTTSL